MTSMVYVEPNQQQQQQRKTTNEKAENKRQRTNFRIF